MRARSRRAPRRCTAGASYIARTLQQSLLPTVIPDIPSCELAIRFAPAGAGDLVGGDFYDVFAVGDDHWAIVIGDVCGKGAGRGRRDRDGSVDAAELRRVAPRPG